MHVEMVATVGLAIVTIANDTVTGHLWDARLL